jgi:hypothetical protein
MVRRHLGLRHKVFQFVIALYKAVKLVGIWKHGIALEYEIRS